MIRLGTRGSPLALAQAAIVAEALRRRGVAVDTIPIRTEGDRRLDARLAALGGKGLFVRELEEALLDDAIDAAVHSLKDLPAELPAGLCLAAYLEREDPRDVLVTPGGLTLDELPEGAVVGTGSPRRRALLLSLRPDLAVEPIRGNVDTRLRKLDGGSWDGLILAAAGLSRLGLTPAQARWLEPEVFVPAVGQGVLAIEARRRDDRVLGLLAPLDHAPTRICAVAERAYLVRLGASCYTPTAAHATLGGASLRLRAMVASEDGKRILRGESTGAPDDAEAVGRALAELLLGQGAASLVPLAPAGRGPSRGER